MWACCARPSPPRSAPRKSRALFTGAATVFTVANFAAGLAHYRDALGFAVTFQWGEPAFDACLCRDDVQLHLIAATATQQNPDHGSLCIFVTDVDAIHAELLGRGANIIKPSQAYDYGMRDVVIRDPDGNRITFGMAASRDQPARVTSGLYTHDPQPKIRLIPAAPIDDSSINWGCWYRAPGWPVAARQTKSPSDKFMLDCRAFSA